MTLEILLQGIPNVCVYLDDILVTGKTNKEHLKNLGEVLTRLETAGIRLKEQKCAFLLSEVEYLGYRITPERQLPTLTKVKAITEAPAPTNISELRIGQLLWQIHEQLGYNPSTLVQAFAEKHQLVMGARTEIRI